MAEFTALLVSQYAMKIVNRSFERFWRISSCIFRVGGQGHFHSDCVKKKT